MFEEFLENIIQFGWLGTPTSSSSSLLFELGIEYMKDHDGSWMKIILKEICISKIVLMIKLFFWTFWKNILISFKIMLGCHSWLNELIAFYCCEALDTFLHATLCWSSASKRSIDLSQPDDLLCVMECWNTNNFYFILFYFTFTFSFRWWRSTWYCSHMTCHMMWCHRPRRWWKDLEDDIRAHVYNMATLRQTWGRSMDIRAGLIISSTDHEDFV